MERITTKPTTHLIAGALLMAVATAPAQEVWEGSDDFSSAATLSQKWKFVVNHPSQGRGFVENGALRYFSAGNAKDSAWAWGRQARSIPSSASWQIDCDLRLYPPIPPPA